MPIPLEVVIGFRIQVSGFKVLPNSYRPCRVCTAMLRVTMLSGEQVASIPVMELSDVRSLKQRLHRLHNFPTRFRQRLLHEGSPLGDDAKLDSIADLELLLLSYHPTSQSQADELVTAAMNGFVDQVRVPGNTGLRV